MHSISSGEQEVPSLEIGLLINREIFGWSSLDFGLGTSFGYNSRGLFCSSKLSLVQFVAFIDYSNSLIIVTSLLLLLRSLEHTQPQNHLRPTNYFNTVLIFPSPKMLEAD